MAHTPPLDQTKGREREQPKARGSDFLQLDPSRTRRGQLAQWLAEQVRGAISDGRLPEGSKLPPSRELARDLAVSRSVVTEAYRRLSEDGHLSGRKRGGTVVVSSPIAPPAPQPRSERRSATTAQPFIGPPAPNVFEELRAAEARTDLSPGVPDLVAFPRAAWLQAERRALAALPASALGYGQPAGARQLRNEVARWLGPTRGIRAGPDEVVIVAGVAQGLALVAQVLRDSGLSAVAIEDPGSLGARQQFEAAGLQALPIEVDDEGLSVAELRSVEAKAVFVTPAHQFPMGVVLSPQRRRELFQWASARGAVIEDDYDAEHRYDRPPVPALRAVMPGHVFYLGSVSKLLAPALRTGWVVPPKQYLSKLVDAKRTADLGNPLLPQLVLAELLRSGSMERHVRSLRGRHKRRRDAMMAALAEHMPSAQVHGAAAGLHLTITFGPKGCAIDDLVLAEACLKRGVKVHPLSWHRQRPGAPGLVLGYAANDPSSIADGIKEVAAACSGSV